MDQNKNYEEMFGQFVYYQQQLHLKNQNKIRVGLKVNILLPLVFLVISFITEGSKFVFLILWIVSLFGISFYLLYIEFSDFKLVEKMKEFGVIDKHEETALIGSEVAERIDELQDFEFFTDIKELKEGIASDIKTIKEKMGEAKVGASSDSEDNVEESNSSEEDDIIETEGGNDQNE